MSWGEIAPKPSSNPSWPGELTDFFCRGIVHEMGSVKPVELSALVSLVIRGTAWNDWNVQFLRRSTRQEVLIGWSLKDCNWQSTWLSEIATMSSISWRGWRVQDIERASLYPAISSYCIICFNIFHPNWKVKQARHPSLPSGSSGHTTRCTLGPAEVHSQSQTCRRSAPWRNAMPRSADMYDMSDMYEVGHGWPLMCFPLL